jgi:hypothetical protein
LTAIVLHSHALFGSLLHLDAQALSGRNVVIVVKREVGQNILYYTNALLRFANLFIMCTPGALESQKGMRLQHNGCQMSYRVLPGYS